MLRLFEKKKEESETRGKVDFYLLAKSEGKSIGFQKRLKDCASLDQLNAFYDDIEKEFLAKKTEHPNLSNIDIIIQFEGLIKSHEVKFTFGDLSFFKTCMKEHFERLPSLASTQINVS